MLEKTFCKKDAINASLKIRRLLKEYAERYVITRYDVKVQTCNDFNDFGENYLICINIEKEMKIKRYEVSAEVLNRLNYWELDRILYAMIRVQVGDVNVEH